jgi:hypothetical protein
LVQITTGSTRHRAQGAPERRFGAAGGGGIEQVDAEIEGGMDDADCMVFVLAGAEPQPAETAAAEPGNADLEPGAPERGVIHS